MRDVATNDRNLLRFKQYVYETEIHVSIVDIPVFLRGRSFAEI